MYKVVKIVSFFLDREKNNFFLPTDLVTMLLHQPGPQLKLSS